jgi:hypothetical protein
MNVSCKFFKQILEVSNNSIKLYIYIYICVCVCVCVCHTHICAVVNNKMCDRPWNKWSEHLRRVQSAKIRIRHNVTFDMCFLSCYTRQTVMPRGSYHEFNTSPFVSQPNFSNKKIFCYHGDCE